MHNLFQEQTSAYAKKIGVMLWWTVPKCSISRRSLEIAAFDYGIPNKYVPNKISYTSAFNRGISSVKQALDNGEKVLLRSLKKTNATDKTKVAVVHETITSGKTAEYEQLGIIELDASAEQVHRTLHKYDSETTDRFNRVWDKVQEGIEEAKKYGADDIRAVLTSFCKDGAISLRESGGIYFVSAAHEQTLNKLTKFVKRLCPDAVIYIKPEYIVSAADLAPLQMVGQSELAREVAALENAAVSLQAELAGLRSHELRGKKSRQGKFVNVMQDYVDAKNRVETFSQTLDLKSGELLGKLKAMHSDLQKQMDRLSVSVDRSISSAFEQMLEEIGEPATQSPPVQISQPLPPPAPPQESIVSKKAADAISRLSMLLEDL